MLGQLSGEEGPDGGLDLPGGDGGPLVVVGKAGSFGSDTFEDVVDEGVHDAHSLGGYTSVGVDLFQDLVDVDGIRFLAPAVLLLAILGDSLGGFSCLLGGLSGYFWWHVVVVVDSEKLMNTPSIVLLFKRKDWIPLDIRTNEIRVSISNLGSMILLVYYRLQSLALSQHCEITKHMLSTCKAARQKHYTEGSSANYAQTKTVFRHYSVGSSFFLCTICNCGYWILL